MFIGIKNIVLGLGVVVSPMNPQILNILSGGD